MRRIHILAVFLLALTASSARAEFYHLWSHGYGDSLAQNVTGVAVDSDGSIAITGILEGTLDLGGGPLASQGGRDIFVARFNADGTHRWSHRFGDAAPQVCSTLAMGPDGETVLVGYMGGTVDFGGGPLAAMDDYDVFLASFDRDGVHQWSHVFPFDQGQYGRSVAVDTQGNVLVTGNFNGHLDVGGGELMSAGGSDVFLAKFDSGGNHVWSRRFGGTLQDLAAGVAVDGIGDVVIAGSFLGTIDLGGGVLSSAGDYDVFLARLDAAGDHLWSQRYGARKQESVLSLACSPDGSIALSGSFQQTINMGGGDLVAPGTYGTYLAAVDAGGGHRWSMALPLPATAATIRSMGFSQTSLLACGVVSGSLDLGGFHLVSRGSADVMLLEFDGAGGVIDAASYGSDGLELATVLAVTNETDVVVGGYYVGLSNLGGNDLPLGRDDIFVAAYARSDPNYTPIVAFSAVLGANGVEARWVFSFEDSSATYRLMRSADGGATWKTVSEGAAAQGTNGHDDTAVAPGRTYGYRVALTVLGREYLSPVFSVTVPVVPTASLAQNTPNPFHGVTTINYSLAEAAPVVITIYDAAGRRVAQLDDGTQSAGSHAFAWNGRDFNGQPLASGVYFYRLRNTPAVGARKMLLLR